MTEEPITGAAKAALMNEAPDTNSTPGKVLMKTRYIYEVFKGSDKLFEVSFIETDPDKVAERMSVILNQNMKGITQVSFKLRYLEVLE